MAPQIQLEEMVALLDLLKFPHISRSDLHSALDSTPDSWAAMRQLCRNGASRPTDSGYETAGQSEVSQCARQFLMKGGRVLLAGERGYPDRLGAMPDPPPLLFITGRDILNKWCVAVVGTREASTDMLRLARAQGTAVAMCGAVLVCAGWGCVGAEAARGAAEAGGEVIVVLSCGHLRAGSGCRGGLTASELSSSSGYGAVVSEMAPTATYDVRNTAKQYELISALSSTVVVLAGTDTAAALAFQSMSARHNTAVIPWKWASGSRYAQVSEALQAVGCKAVDSLESLTDLLHTQAPEGAAAVGHEVFLTTDPMNGTGRVEPVLQAREGAGSACSVTPVESPDRQISEMEAVKVQLSLLAREMSWLTRRLSDATSGGRQALDRITH